MKEYDLIVIGAGWAGFNACQRARELGLKVALVEQAEIGGTCLNYGCIPTKALIQSAKVYALNKKSEIFGIEQTAGATVNFTKVQERKEKIIQQLRLNMGSLLKGVDLFRGQAKITNVNKVTVDNQLLSAKFILLATGSHPVALKDINFDNQKIIFSDQLLNIKEIPKALLIIGGGVIGCEFAGLFSMFGSQISIVEKMPQLLPGIDIEIAKKIETIFKKRGIKVNTNSVAVETDFKNFDLVLLCVGRVPNISNFGLENLNVKLEGQEIAVDDYLKTSVPNIYAAGDCTAKVMLAHFASYQGRLAVDNMFGGIPKKMDDTCVPSCIFTEPEIAVVGLSEEAAIKNSLEINIHKFDFLGSGMARLMEETQGFIKIISHKKTNEIIGGAIIGPKATELIGILTVAAANRLKISQLKETIFAHPTLSEAITEAL